MAAPSNPSLPVFNSGIDYTAETARISEFIESYTPPPRALRVVDEENDESGNYDEDGDDQDLGAEQEDVEMDDEDGLPRRNSKYMRILQRIASRQTSHVTVNMVDVNAFDPLLAQSIQKNTRRYVDLFSAVIDKLIPPPSEDRARNGEMDVLDLIMEQRRQKNEEILEGAPNNVAQGEIFPPELMRRYTLYFKPALAANPLPIRSILSPHLGTLITTRCIVTRISSVSPHLLVNAYSCDSCGAENFQEVNAIKFMPLLECQSAECQANGAKGRLIMQTRAGRFEAYQEGRVQEMADQVPVGHIPRSMTVHLRGPLVRSLSPGDTVDLSGIFLPASFSGARAMRLGLLQDTFLEVQSVRQLKKGYSDLEVTPEMAEELEELKDDPEVYSKLAASIAPEIYGHEDIKKALLLLLIGGVNKNTGDGVKIRGDINVCLMGDPGVAKSQLLKFICKIAPRGIYTTGKGSSGVGLTAAVMRDPGTDEFVLEGGALVLADNGICAIDEFDKMDESDRTAIHEVMEQQTISISKAGISTTLNARTSILAAANPLYGRYNPKISPVENINLPAALLSRFDVMFLVLDTPSREEDERLARHITHVHMYEAGPQLEWEPVKPRLMRHFIANARSLRPTVPNAVAEYVVSSYVRLRQQQKSDELEEKYNTYTSARTLLAVLRLSQAHARVRGALEVGEEDVDEALRLMEVSKSSLVDYNGKDKEGTDQSAMSKIYRIIRDTLLASAGGGMEVDGEEEDAAEVPLVDIRGRVLAKGFTEAQLMECIIEYEDLGVIQRVANGTRLRFVDAGDDD